MHRVPSRLLRGVAVAVAAAAVLGGAIAGAAPGDLDPSFGTGGLVTTDLGTGTEIARGLALQPDGKLVAAGTSGCSFALARYLSDGALDPGFGSGGRVTTSIGTFCGDAYSLVRQGDGKLVSAGRASGAGGSDFALTRHNSDGTLDTDFGDDGIVLTDVGGGNDRVWDLAVQPDGKLVAAGRTTIPCTPFCTGPNQFLIVRYDVDGSLDGTFGVGGIVRVDFFVGGEGEALAIALQPDGKIVASGRARPPVVPGPPVQIHWAIARLDSSGTLDPSFGAGGKVAVLTPSGGGPLESALAIQSDGKLVVGGYGGSSPGPQGVSLVRFHPDGALDTSFGGSGQVVVEGFGEAHQLFVQPDGKLIAAGGVPPDFALWRFLSDGSLDASFGSGGVVTTDVPGFGDGAWALATLLDGRMALAGGYEDFVLARYLGDPTEVTFASMDAEAAMLLPKGPANDMAWLLATFKLGETTDGIDPPSETVALGIGETALTLPPGSFSKSLLGWSYKGSVEGATWHVTIRHTVGGVYLLNAVGTRLDLEPPPGTIDVRVAIGDDAGSAATKPLVPPRR
jgi:uncharacterized delta-60 repeat protein